MSEKIIDFENFKKNKEEKDKSENPKKDEILEQSKEGLISVKMELLDISPSSLYFSSIKDFLGEKYAVYDGRIKEDSGSIYLNLFKIESEDFQELKKMLDEKGIDYKIE